MHQRPTDTRCLIPHLEKVKSQLGKLSGTVIADAGYGGEKNYNYLEKNRIEAVVKYSTYHREKSKAWQTVLSKIDNWRYDAEADARTCAAGHMLHFRRVSKETTESGYEIEYRHYRKRLRVSRSTYDRTGACIWRYQEQPRVQTFPASRAI